MPETQGKSCDLKAPKVSLPLSTGDPWKIYFQDLDASEVSKDVGKWISVIEDQLAEILSCYCDADLKIEVRNKLFIVKRNLSVIRNAIGVHGNENKDDEGFGGNGTKIDQSGLTNWEQLGEGGFSRVFKARRTEGNEIVAVKVLREDALNEPLMEGKLLSILRHKNIVSFRGMNILTNDIEAFGLKSGMPFIVMEFLGDNLGRYIESLRTAENQGLQLSQVWDFAQQIASGLHYLHTLKPPGPIAHKDLKPDNILLDKGPFRMHLKLADFGLSAPIDDKIFGSEASASVMNIRWQAPEVWMGEEEEEESEVIETQEESEVIEIQKEIEWDEDEEYESDIEFYMRADVYSFGMITAYMVTGDKPWKGKKTISINDCRSKSGEQLIELPSNLTGPLLPIVKKCYQIERFNRPSLQELLEEYFQTDENPYEATEQAAEFFSCGLLKETYIFVADSRVQEDSSGFFKTKVRPEGYPHKCLICEVEVGNAAYANCSNDWDYEDEYRDRYRHWKQAALNKEIEDNPAIALKKLAMSREDLEERQEIVLKFGQSTYCHHRAMRDIWRSLDEGTKREELPCKGTVHPVFSTSFGLHVAVLTADKPQKFIFTRRANRGGMASPGTITCGAVESAAVKDYEETNDKTYVNLVKTAARGLDEELRVELKGDDLQAISLSTIYLKYDNHEWGLCGFVDLSDERITKERRLTYSQLKSRFTAGPKDKFEHEEVIPVDFNLYDMVVYVRNNYNDFASSAKLVVVKVLQEFYGVEEVEKAFNLYDDK